MKAISIRQPWASLIANGTKTIETRTWSTDHRGPLLICASKPDGRALCVVDVVDCRPMKRADSKAACCEPYDGAFAWVLRNVKLLEPFPVKGQLRLFEREIPPAALSGQRRAM